MSIPADLWRGEGGGLAGVGPCWVMPGFEECLSGCTWTSWNAKKNQRRHILKNNKEMRWWMMKVCDQLTADCSWPSSDQGWGWVQGPPRASKVADSSPAVGWPASGPPPPALGPRSARPELRKAERGWGKAAEKEMCFIDDFLFVLRVFFKHVTIWSTKSAPNCWLSPGSTAGNLADRTHCGRGRH